MSDHDGAGTPPEPPREPQVPTPGSSPPVQDPRGQEPSAPVEDGQDDPERTRIRLPLFQDTARYTAPAPPSPDAEATRTRLPRVEPDPGPEVAPGAEQTRVALPPTPAGPASPVPPPPQAPAQAQTQAPAQAPMHLATGGPVLPPPPQGWDAAAPSAGPAAPAPAPRSEEPEDEGRSSRRWLPVVLIGALALVLVAGAYVAGRAFTGGADSTADKLTATPTPSPTAAPTSSAPTTPAASASPTPAKKPVSKAYRGKVTSVPVRTIAAGCIARSGVDSAGRKVGYGAANAVDGKPGTAWRCDGAATGRTLTFYLPRGVRVAEVGLIPGYAKTDPRSHTDRYAENNRITKVQWTVGKTKVTQTMSGSPKDRRLRTIRIPATRASTVTLRILSVAKGSRNTTMISEVRIARAG